MGSGEDVIQGSEKKPMPSPMQMIGSESGKPRRTSGSHATSAMRRPRQVRPRM